MEIYRIQMDKMTKDNSLAGNLDFHMTMHFPPPVGSPGVDDFSISAIIFSNAKPTFVLSLALHSMKLQLNSSASFRPWSAETNR